MILRLPDGRAVVGGNSFDLVAADRPEPAEVSVVIPHFEAQAQLDLVLTALRLQTHPLTRLEVIVADDGSAVPPDLQAAQGLSVSLVTQERRGFRAAAARNLGADRAAGDILCFLDGDTIPDPNYITELSRLPASLPDALVVGRREHADLTGWDPARLTGWLTGDGAPPEVLEFPMWLAQGYGASRNLLEADDRSFRFVISAVLGMTASLFRELGGLDPTFPSYGGEDWELAHRAWNGGAVFAHEPAALAWHDGPEWAGRGGRRKAKNAETLELAIRIPQERTRARHVIHRRPELVVVFDNSEWGDAATVVTADSFLAFGSVAVYLTRAVRYLEDDPRVKLGIPDLTECAVFAQVEAPCAFDVGQLPAFGGRLVVADGLGTLLELTTSRSARRVHRWAAEFPEHDLMADLFGEKRVEAEEAAVSRLPAEPDLDRLFRTLGSPAKGQRP